MGLSLVPILAIKWLGSKYLGSSKFVTRNLFIYFLALVGSLTQVRLLMSVESRFVGKIDEAFLALGCALFYKPIWQLTVNERGHYADSEDTFLFKIEDSPDTRLGA